VNYLQTKSIYTHCYANGHRNNYSMRGPTARAVNKSDRNEKKEIGGEGEERGGDARMDKRVNISRV
jgi:hypothetical protein